MQHKNADLLTSITTKYGITINNFIDYPKTNAYDFNHRHKILKPFTLPDNLIPIGRMLCLQGI